jgi:hypothetical protein
MSLFTSCLSTQGPPEVTDFHRRLCDPVPVGTIADTGPGSTFRGVTKMLNQLKTILTTLLCTIWCHRVTYAGLALAYGAGCLGVIEKETVAQIATAL